MPSKMWDEINNNLSMLGLKLSHASKKGPRKQYNGVNFIEMTGILERTD